ncbi:hypothetical protein HUG17_5981 [Dermatophagoides farinae]|uniref:CRAL-TRIO domain-containing protein n=1 Tax=Dermatophagoides farinae TaxID=6954 RepID=A0A9D4P3C0_DERFA|nr:hypothetical protein HUG17_5981 [Dermatophagoides farinae]
MDRFLQFCRFNLSNVTAFKKLSIVIGNESCDLDSAVSAIVLAYIKYHELTKHQDDDDDDQDDSEVIVLPVLNVFREDLHLRREIVFWFEKVLQFELEWLICRDEIDFDAINSSSTVQVFISLVDHNDNKEFQKLLPRAQFDEIIDHHQPPQQHSCSDQSSSSSSSPQYIQCDPSKVQIDTGVGSCCSLIALRYFKSNITKHKFGSPVKSSSETFDSQIALILYGPILLDTICFEHSASRFNAKDYEAINKLEDLMKHPADSEPSLYDRNEVYQRLVAAKNSLDGLSFEDLLRKDMKIVESISDNNLAICISSVTGILLTEMSLRDKLKELKNYSNQPPKTAVFSDQSRPRTFNAIILMSLDNRIPNNLRRQLAIFCSNKHLMRTIATCIERSEQLSLELITALESLRIYNQNNLKASRKVVLPIISTILNGPGASNGTIGETTKRNDPVTITNGNGELTINTTATTSAPSSFIQQPDSYYGSFIDDSFVGEFVGDYPNVTDSMEHENILVMDADGQNLVLMNPVENSCLSHTHEIEFDFESFGPESIMYAGNVEQQQQQQSQTEQQINQKKEMVDSEKNMNDVSAVENVNDDDTVETVQQHQQTDADDEQQQQQQQQVDENKDPNVVLNFSKKAEANDQEKMQNNRPPTINVENPSQQQSSSQETEEKKEDAEETNNNNKQSNEQQQQQSLAFNRNSTLTKSQRKKVVPQMNIKNLVLASDAFSPPALEQIMTPPLLVTGVSSTSQDMTMMNGNNFINDHQSSNSPDNNNSSQTLPKIVLNDPLGVSNSFVNNNSNPSPSTLGRNQSMKKKIEVNYTMFLNQTDVDDKNASIDPNINIKTNGDESSSDVLNTQSDIDPTNDNGDGGDIQSDRRSSLPLSAIEFRSIDLKVIEPYKNVLSHGGHLRPSSNGEAVASEFSSPAIILFSACYLPDRSRIDYHYVMDNLFLYVVSTLHNMVADDYILIYLHNGGNVHQSSITATGQQQQQHSVNNMPTFSWLKRCYQMIDRKLKKNLKGLYLVHPTFWLKTLIIMSKPFISSKFSRKLKFVRSLDELKQLIPIDDLDIPDLIKTYDHELRMSKSREQNT